MDSKKECSSFSPQKVTDAFMNSIAENLSTHKLSPEEFLQPGREKRLKGFQYIF